MSNKPGLTVLAGPTAVGKGTVSTYIRDNYPGVWLSVSATTRPPHLSIDFCLAQTVGSGQGPVTGRGALRPVRTGRLRSVRQLQGGIQ